ncbi:MAG TPA: ATP-binding protein, partial [Geobacteraceae bacterium]
MFRSLSVKINVAIILLVVLILGGAGYLTLVEQNRQAEENAKTKTRLITQTVTNVIRLEMESPHAKDLEKLIEVMGQFQEIETLRIFDVDGRILHSADAGEIGRGIDDLVMNVFLSGDMAKPFRSEEEGHRSMCRVDVVYNEPACYRCHGDKNDVIGVVEVCLTMAAMDQQIERNARFTLVSTLATLLVVALALSLLITGMVTRPVAALSRVMGQAQAGNLAARGRAHDRDELGRLARSFNDMIARLDDANKEVARLHREQMSRAERLASIGEMAASVAHEIKNPLAGLSGATQILAKTFPEGDPHREVVGEMLKLTGRLDKTINDLLSFARVADPVWQSVNPNDVVEETLFFLRKDHKVGDSVLTETLDPLMPDVPLDPQQIQQVLFNLCINARQACGDKGKVTVATSARPTGTMYEGADPNDYVEIRVEDDGPGIRPENMGEIFKPFFTTKVQGTGLGLP